MILKYTEPHADGVEFTIAVEKQIDHIDSKFQSIDVFESKTFGRFFTIDGFLMITEKDEFIYHEMITHVAMATNLDNIKNVLVIGAGDGGTVRELCKYKTIEKIEMVEIDEEVVNVAKKYFPNVSSGFSDSRVKLFFEDAVKFIKNTKSKYDLIIVDSTDPFSVGEGLFTSDFYKDCFNHLTDDGILINQHESPYYDNYSIQMKRAHQRISEHFPIAKVYQVHIPTYSSGHWLFGFASKKYNPIKDAKLDEWNKLGINTKYYNTDLHIGCFAIPNYVKDMLGD